MKREKCNIYLMALLRVNCFFNFGGYAVGVYIYWVCEIFRYRYTMYNEGALFVNPMIKETDINEEIDIILILQEKLRL